MNDVVAALVRRILDGYAQPRASVRAMIDQRPGIGAAFLMVVLGYLIQATLAMGLPGLRVPGAGVPIAAHVLGVGVQCASFAILVLLVDAVGRALGGAGTREEAFAAVGWHTLVTSPIAPLLPFAAQAITPERSPLWAVGLLVAAAGAAVWLLAAYVAELHRFRSTRSVLGVLMLVPLGLSVLTLVFLPQG